MPLPQPPPVRKLPLRLPALKLPETKRLFGNHCERPLCGAWGAAVNGAHYPAWTEYTEGRYASAWLGIANRIRLLRYMGQNLAIEGVYMYKQGFPTAKFDKTRRILPIPTNVLNENTNWQQNPGY